MPYYEGMFLLDAAEAAQNFEELKAHVVELISKHGGEVIYTERWQDRKLAYEIKGKKKGTYLLTYFQVDGDRIAEIRRDAQLSDRILRVLILRNDQAPEEAERRKEAKAREKVAVATEEVSAPPIVEEEEDIYDEVDEVSLNNYDEIEEFQEEEEEESYLEEEGQEEGQQGEEAQEEPLKDQKSAQENDKGGLE